MNFWLLLFQKPYLGKKLIILLHYLIQLLNNEGLQWFRAGICMLEQYTSITSIPRASHHGRHIRMRSHIDAKVAPRKKISIQGHILGGSN